MPDTAARQVPGDPAPAERPGDDRWSAFREAGALVEALREAEADPEHGHWIYLRLATTATGGRGGWRPSGARAGAASRRPGPRPRR
ncbi:hypothetical protein [Phytohabitans kaempferiae]|uniref:hypothetical protein n=1 Tax=Phytohabitans kaempferiae TaxID=1620943 RepID=UPI00367208A2